MKSPEPLSAVVRGELPQRHSPMHPQRTDAILRFNLNHQSRGHRYPSKRSSSMDPRCDRSQTVSILPVLFLLRLRLYKGCAQHPARPVTSGPRTTITVLPTLSTGRFLMFAGANIELVL